MNIQTVKLELLKPAEYNPRKDLYPGDKEYEKLRRSISEFGMVEPIVWNKITGNVVGGRQRLKVLIANGETEIECVVVELDDAHEKALNIALNKISGDWDNDKLADLIQDLKAGDIDISVSGFEVREITDLLAEIPTQKIGNAEIETESFSDDAFTCECPECGFRFNE